MHIGTPGENFLDKEQVRKDLQSLIAQPSANEQIPCPNCKVTSADDCSPKCEQAPKQLSGDPDNYPIEQKVVPLVFELSAARLFQTCWSCEGHFNADGKLWKVPQVSFYSTSLVYPQLLLKHIKGLEQKKRLAYSWQVVLADFGQTWAVTYSIEPNLNHSPEPRLGLLQQDLNTIAENLGEHLKALAREMLQALS